LTGPFPAKVIGIEKIASDKAILNIETAQPFMYKAGQYVEIIVDGFDARFYSMANAPSEKTDVLEFHIKDNGWGGFGTYALNHMAKNDGITIKGPFGDCIWKKNVSNRILMIAGGMGVTQMKALLEESVALGHRGEIGFYWGVNTENDAYNRNEMEQLIEMCGNAKMTVAVGEPLTEVIKKDHTNLKNTEIYLSGPPPMISALVPVFLEQGAELPKIHTDNKKIIDEIIQEIL